MAVSTKNELVWDVIPLCLIAALILLLAVAAGERAGAGMSERRPPAGSSSEGCQSSRDGEAHGLRGTVAVGAMRSGEDG